MNVSSGSIVVSPLTVTVIVFDGVAGCEGQRPLAIET